jgi:hypothetical protein
MYCYSIQACWWGATTGSDSTFSRFETIVRHEEKGNSLHSLVLRWKEKRLYSGYPFLSYPIPTCYSPGVPGCRLRGVLTQTPHRTRTFLATVFLKFDTKPMYPIPFSPPLLVSSVRRCRETFGNATSSSWGYLRLDGEALSDSMAWEETSLLSYFSIVLLSRRNLCALRREVRYRGSAPRGSTS